MAHAVDTKARIAEKALDLFAQRGYGAVSIRDICKAVGIKESTVYYHYENKQAIWDTLMAEIGALIETMTHSFDHAFEGVLSVPDAAMCAVAVGILRNYLLHPTVYKAIAMLAIERMADETADAAYRRIVFDLPLLQQEKVFAQMAQRGIIAPGDPFTLAYEYHAAIYLAFARNCAGGGLTEEKTQAACAEIHQAVGDLYSKMKGARA